MLRVCAAVSSVKTEAVVWLLLDGVGSNGEAYAQVQKMKSSRKPSAIFPSGKRRSLPVNKRRFLSFMVQVRFFYVVSCNNIGVLLLFVIIAFFP